MPWYNTGTVTVTNNSATVTGAGTAWVDNVDAGQAFVGPNGIPYEILSVNSATSITLRTNYVGTTASGQAYRIMPVQGYLRDLATQAAELVLSFATVRDGIGAGKMVDGTVAVPGLRFASDEDTGIFRPSANVLALATGGVEALRVAANGAVQLGTGVSTQARLNIAAGGSGSYAIQISSADGNGGGLIYTTEESGTANGLILDANRGSGKIVFKTGGTESVRVTAGGSVGIGTSAPRGSLELAGAAPGMYLTETDQATDAKTWRVIASGGSFSIQTTNDAVSTAGAAWTVSRNGVFVSEHSWSVNGAARLVLTENILSPNVDSGVFLGSASKRWSVIYSSTGTINTSDGRAKQGIGPIPDEWLNAWGDVDWVRYKFIDSVQAKGDDARWHLGLVAQAVRDAFLAHDLDAQTIGLLCYDQWDEEREPILEEQQVGTETIVIGREDTGILDAQGQPIFRDITEDRPVMVMVDTGETRVTLEAGDRWGLRYDECQAMEAAWQRRELAHKDALVAALTARLEALEAA